MLLLESRDQRIWLQAALRDEIQSRLIDPVLKYDRELKHDYKFSVSSASSVFASYPLTREEISVRKNHIHIVEAAGAFDSQKSCRRSKVKP